MGGRRALADNDVDRDENRQLWGFIHAIDIWNYLEFRARLEVNCYLCSNDRRLSDDMDNASHYEFEEKFCEPLRDGPFEAFHDLEKCRVDFFE